MAQQTAKNANGDPFSFELPNGNGRAAAAASRPVALSTEDKAALDAIATAIEGIEISLPPGGATEAKQDAQSTLLGMIIDGLSAIASAITGTLTVAVHGVTQSGSWVLSAGSAIIGKVGIDRTTPGTTNSVAIISGQDGVAGGAGAVGATTQRMTLASDDPAVATLGAVNGAAVITDANGTIQQYLRGLVKLAITGLTVGAQPARAATTDNIGAKLGTDAIMNGTTALTPKFAKIAASSSGDNTIVTAVTGKKIRVLAYNFVASGAVNAKFQSGAAGTDLTGLKYCDAAGAGICAPFNPVGWFETSAATLLNLNLSGAVAVGGELVYVEV